jgi:hypothetical protein
LWNPQDFQKIAGILLHAVVPVRYVVYWLMLAPKSRLAWKSVLLWLIYPLAYLIYALARGTLSGRYSYPFIDVGELGYSRVFLKTAMLLCVFVGAGLLAVTVSRWLGSDAQDDNLSAGSAVKE